MAQKKSTERVRAFRARKRAEKVSQSNSQGASGGKAIRVSQTLMRPKVRNIAPAQSTQQQRPKTLVLNTIPLKVKQVAPTTIKIPLKQPTVRIPTQVPPQQAAEVCLRWNSYHSNMQTSFPSLLDTEQFVDVTLACEGRSLKCHKMILSTCSDYLAALLRENPCQHPIILMKDLKFWEVEALVNFMYRGEVNVAHDKLPELLNAAEALQIKGLAGPSHSSQNQKPPMLIPQSKPVNSTHQSNPKNTETKELKQQTTAGTTLPHSPKRAMKRIPSETPESHSSSKIRIQRPSSPPSPRDVIKLEPLDIPLSPNDIFSENNEDSSATNYENLIRMHEEEDPGGDERIESADEDIQFCQLPGPPDLNDVDDQMEFVPTDFLEQEQDIVEEPDGGCSMEEVRRSHVNDRNDDDEVDDEVKYEDVYEDDNDDDGTRICKQKEKT